MDTTTVILRKDVERCFETSMEPRGVAPILELALGIFNGFCHHLQRHFKCNRSEFRWIREIAAP